MTNRGAFVISLDFELHWGVRDQVSVERYRENLLGVRRVVPALLKVFARHGIHATWATVGFLFFETREELLASLPRFRPQYADARLSPYSELERIGASESEAPFHFAASLIRMIAASPDQEIGTHTFSHYYCLEPGQTLETFRDDLQAAQRAAAGMELTLKSLVFPRNQVNPDYLGACRELGISTYRGTEDCWLHRAHSQRQESLWRRAVRFADAYLPIVPHTSVALDDCSGAPVNIPSSRFLRPYTPTLRLFEPLRLKRVINEMTYAAQNGRVYHLWWHPHNFGHHAGQNLAALEKILGHFDRLRVTCGMESLNMGELAARVLSGAELQVSHAG